MLHTQPAKAGNYNRTFWIKAGQRHLRRPFRERAFRLARRSGRGAAHPIRCKRRHRSAEQWTWPCARHTMRRMQASAVTSSLGAQSRTETQQASLRDRRVRALPGWAADQDARLSVVLDDEMSAHSQ